MFALFTLLVLCVILVAWMINSVKIPDFLNVLTEAEAEAHAELVAAEKAKAKAKSWWEKVLEWFTPPEARL